MKKLLYTTSALVGAAFLMEAVAPAKAEVNVSLRYRAALTSQGDADGNAAFDLNADGKKHRSTSLNSAKIDFDFNASKDHPNGLTTSAVLKADTAGGGNLSYGDAYGSLSGSFGKIDVGDMQDVGYRTLGYGTPGTGNFGAVDAGFNPSGAYINTSATGNITGRASTITYWSPSFSGAQVGVSWQPRATSVNSQGGRDGIRGKNSNNGHTTSDGDVEDAVAFVASYSGSFGGTGVSMGVSYETAKTRANAVTKYTRGSDRITSVTVPDHRTFFPVDDGGGNNSIGDLVLINAADSTISSASYASGGTGLSATDAIATGKNQDPSAFAGYVSFDVGQFSIGGSYGAWEDASADGSTTSEATAYAIGAGYSIDALTFGIGWAKQTKEETLHNYRIGTFTANGATKAEIDKAVAGKRDVDQSILAFTTSYNLGDGADLDFVIERGQYHTGGPIVLKSNSAVLSSAEVKSTAFGVGIDLKF